MQDNCNCTRWSALWSRVFDRKIIPSPAQPSCKELGAVFVFFLLFASVCLFFTAFSSPFFRYSSSSDSNVYFSIARAMQNGLSLYRDVFDHKGVLLYLIYYVPAWLIPTNMNGVYFLLTISLAVTLLYGYRLARLFLPSLHAMFAPLAIIFFSIASSIYEDGGGSTEELLMPCIMACLYYLIRHQLYIDGSIQLPKINRFSGAFIGGIFCAVTLWTKYSMLTALFLPYLILILGMVVRKRKTEILEYLGAFLLGSAVLSSIPISYLWRHGLFSEFWNAYVIFNLEYSSSHPKFVFKYFAQMLCLGALLPSIISLLGVTYLAKINSRVTRNCCLIILSHALSSILFMVSIGKYFSYYYLGFAPMTVLGAVAGVRFISRLTSASEKRTAFQTRQRLILVVFYVMTLAIGLFHGSALWIKGSVVSPRTGFEKAAATVNDYWDQFGNSETPNIIHFACIDKGLYELCHTYPREQYFYKPFIDGVHLKFILNEQIQYIKEGRPDIVVFFSSFDETAPVESINADYYLLYEDRSKSSSEYMIYIFAKTTDKNYNE